MLLRQFQPKRADATGALACCREDSFGHPTTARRAGRVLRHMATRAPPVFGRGSSRGHTRGPRSDRFTVRLRPCSGRQTRPERPDRSGPRGQAVRGAARRRKRPASGSRASVGPARGSGPSPSPPPASRTRSSVTFVCRAVPFRRPRRVCGVAHPRMVHGGVTSGTAVSSCG
jgi:hypothetical protein